jgi:hypothetical protein
VLPIVRFDGVEEAIELVNEMRYGLTASVWTRDIGRAERIAERLDVGTVTVNNHSVTGAIAALPWSGTRETGYGIANSEHALTLFCRPKSLLVDTSKDPEPYWLPFDEDLFSLGDALADAMTGHLGNAWKIPLLALKRVRTVKRFWAK